MSIRLRILKVLLSLTPKPPLLSFTGVDPFEDTESIQNNLDISTIKLSQVSIRLRILKVAVWAGLVERHLSFTGVDPFEDTESRRCSLYSFAFQVSFTGVDPFEDTESRT